jgi:hypothetical protein
MLAQCWREQNMAITIGQLKDYLRDGLQSVFEWRCGLGASGEVPALIFERNGGFSFAAPDTMESDNIAAANLLAGLIDDVDNLDPIVAATVLDLLNSCNDPTAIFFDGRFQAMLELIGQRSKVTSVRWRPTTATAVLRHALATAQI